MCGPQLSFSGQTGHYVILLNGPPWSAGQRLVGEQRWTLVVVPFRLVPPRPGMAVDIAQSSSPWYTAQEQPDPCPPIPNIWALPPCEMSESWFCSECCVKCPLSLEQEAFPTEVCPRPRSCLCQRMERRWRSSNGEQASLVMGHGGLKCDCLDPFYASSLMAWPCQNSMSNVGPPCTPWTLPWTCLERAARLLELCTSCLDCE